jgi:Smg protein
MKEESVLDVLMYLFENYSDTEFGDAGNHDALKEELSGAGFPEEEVRHAFEWLDGLAEGRKQLSLFGSTNVIRIYSRQEIARLSTDCRGFLMYLEQLGILTPALRELAIDRVMEIDDDIDLEKLKWVLLLVLMHHPGSEAALEQMQELVQSEGEYLH